MPTEKTKERLNIRISIEDLQFPLTVNTPEEEKYYRDAAQQIQSQLQRLRAKFPSLPSEKYYYGMALLLTTVKALQTANLSDNGPYMEMMKGLEKEIDNLEA
ncbi:MAG: cell division protein ZapA [Bacteroidaceae bacterium]|nr:cell division protein ZapA [Bacteroidaceae bacterium]